MIRVTAPCRTFSMGIPRESGDDPILAGPNPNPLEYSPRERG